MGTTELFQLAQTLSVVLAIIVAFATLKGKSNDKTVELTTMAVDIKYIKDKIGGMDTLRDELTKAKASASSAHKRLDDHLRYDHHQSIEKRSSDE